MVFSSPLFLFLFLPLVLTGYWLVPGTRGRNLWLLLASLAFYAWGEVAFILLLVASTAAAPPIDAYELTFVDQPAGDLAQISGGELVARERNAPQLVPRPPLSPLEIHPGTNPLERSGTPDPVLVHTERTGQRHRILLFRDSFATRWQPSSGSTSRALSTSPSITGTRR